MVATLSNWPAIRAEAFANTFRRTWMDYCSDASRTLATGPPTAHMLELLREQGHEAAATKQETSGVHVIDELITGPLHDLGQAPQCTDAGSSKVSNCSCLLAASNFKHFSKQW